MREEKIIAREIVTTFYRELNRMHLELFGGLISHRMFDSRIESGYYPACVKNNDGIYEDTEYPAATIIVKGLCVIDIDIEQIYISTALGKERAFKLNYDEFKNYKFDVAPYKMVNDIIFSEGDSAEDLKDRILKSRANSFYYTFIFNYDELDKDKIYEFAKLLVKRDFFYKTEG